MIVFVDISCLDYIDSVVQQIFKNKFGVVDFTRR